MPRTKGRLFAIFTLMGLVMLASLAVVYGMGLRVTAANRQVIRLHEIIDGIEDILITVQDAETGQRGFLLAGENTYLDPYNGAERRARTDLELLKNWASAGELPASAIAGIEDAVNSKLAELKETIELRSQGGLQAALPVVLSDGGKRMMDDIRAQVGRLIAVQTQKLHQAERLRDQSTTWRTITAAVMGIATLVFLAWAHSVIHEEMRISESASAAIGRQKELLSVTLKSIGDAVIVTDAEAAITFMNPEAEHLTGWKGDEASGRPLSEIFRIVNEQTHQPVESPVDKVLRLGIVVGLANHTVLIGKDGRRTPIDDSGAPVRGASGEIHGVVLVFRDFSKHRAAEKALQQSEQLFRSLANTIPQLAWMAHPDGHIFWYNGRWFEYTGTTQQQMKGWGWQSVHDPELLPNVLAQWKNSLATGEPFAMEFPLRGADGQFRWFLTRIVPVRDADGNIARWFGTNTDIDEKKETEAALRDAKLSAERAKATAEDANAAKDRFLAVLSHELRTPLMPVLSAVSLLHRQRDLDEDTRSILEMVQRNVELEARLIDDLLDLTRIARGRVDLDRHPVELHTIIERAVEVCRPDLQVRKLQLDVETGCVKFVVAADAARLQQVFWNLLKNAIKFTPDGGRISVRCQSEGDGHVLVEVADTGIGIEPMARQRIFDAFEQGNALIARQLGGLGLGLAISKTLVELHGGTIEAESDGPGKGSVFRVRLALVNHARGDLPAPAESPGELPAAARPLRVLLVEDHGDTARVVRRILEMEGHKVAWAGDVASALQNAASDAFDLLISDVGLPDGSGLDLMRELRSRGHKLPGIALSGYGQEDDVAQSRRAGFIAHMVKPMNMEQLVTAVAHISRTIS
jgi:PAS domain S-box-containing protein